MIFITSDLHLFHDREFIYKPRGFDSVKDMMNCYINEWKSKVTEDDDIYIVGDFCLGSGYGEIEKLLNSLPGRIHLLIGNHDTDAKVEFYKARGIDAKYVDVIIYKKRRFYLSHYPTHTSSLESDPKNCVINLHGHIHTKEKFYEDIPFMYNVSVDANNNHFVTLDEVLKTFNKKVKECISYL